MKEIHDAEVPVYRALEELRIPWKRYEHPPVFTVEEAERHWAEIPATHCKNLFLRNKKATVHYLAILESSRRVDIGGLTSRLSEDRLSFGSPERLATYLGVTPGSVSPFGLINPAAKDVRVVIDAGLRGVASVAFHPNINTATIVLAWPDFERFLAWRGNIVRYVDM